MESLTLLTLLYLDRTLITLHSFVTWKYTRISSHGYIVQSILHCHNMLSIVVSCFYLGGISYPYHINMSQWSFDHIAFLHHMKIYCHITWNFITWLHHIIHISRCHIMQSIFHIKFLYRWNLLRFWPMELWTNYVPSPRH